MRCRNPTARCCDDAPDAYVAQERIAALYDSKAPVYDIWAWFTESRARKRAIELADIEDGQTIVEVAVGTGLAYYEIVRRNPRGVNLGIDLSQAMLKRAVKRLHGLKGANYKLEIASAHSLPMADNSADILVNSYMFDLIPFQDMDRIIMEFKRVMKRDGKLVLVNMTRGERFGSGIYERIYKLSPEAMGGCRGVELVDRLKRQGFEVLNREYIQQMLFPSEVILARPSGARS